MGNKYLNYKTPSSGILNTMHKTKIGRLRTVNLLIQTNNRSLNGHFLSWPLYDYCRENCTLYKMGNQHWFMISNLDFMKHGRWSAFFIDLYNVFWVPIDKSIPKVPAKTLTYSVVYLKEAEVGFDPSSVKFTLQLE